MLRTIFAKWRQSISYGLMRLVHSCALFFLSREEPFLLRSALRDLLRKRLSWVAVKVVADAQPEFLRG